MYATKFGSLDKNSLCNSKTLNRYLSKEKQQLLEKV